MRTLLVILMVLAGGMAAAQESGAPVVSTESPAQPGAPAGDAGAALPSLPADTSTESGNPPQTAPATEAAGTPPAAEVTPVPPAPGAAAPDAAAPAPTVPVPAAPDAGTPAVTPAQSADPAAPAAPVPGAAATDVPAPASPAAPAATPLAPAAAAPAPLLPTNTDLFHIVMEAHWVVLAVMIGLAVAAFATLVILIHKTVEFGLAFGKLGRVARALSRAGTLDEAEAAIGDAKGPGADMVRASAEELRLAVQEPALQAGVRERTSAALGRIDAGAAQRLRGGTGILASIGSLSPFVGLFGTVFGIMNSFLAIAETKTTNLAVVAPGIAEALLATAIGLAAAIPAVLIYNICARRLAKYRLRLADVGAAAERLQSRALDRLAAGA